MLHGACEDWSDAVYIIDTVIIQRKVTFTLPSLAVLHYSLERHSGIQRVIEYAL